MRVCLGLVKGESGRRCSSSQPHKEEGVGKMRKVNYPKVAAALLAVGLLAKFVRDRFGHSGSTGNGAARTWQRPTREADTVEGEERSDRTDRTTEHQDELRVRRTEEELRAGTREREAGEVSISKTVRTERES